MVPARGRAQRSARMQDAVSFEDSQRLDKRHAGAKRSAYDRLYRH